MKSYILLFIVLISLAGFANGQEVIRQIPCFDTATRAQVDSVKKEMAGKGFIMVREASMKMESGYEMPVIVPLTQGSWYHFVFVGDLSSRLYEVRMYDYNEKQVIYEKHYGDGVESNIIGFSYVPKFSEYHIIKPVQVNKRKKKEICGYIIMFKKVK